MFFCMLSPWWRTSEHGALAFGVGVFCSFLTSTRTYVLPLHRRYVLPLHARMYYLYTACMYYLYTARMYYLYTHVCILLPCTKRM